MSFLSLTATRRRRRLSAGLAIAGALALLLACSSDDPDAAGDGTNGEADTIVVQVSGEAEELAVYEQLVASIDDDLTDVDVELVGVADKGDHLERLVSSFAAGNPPDVFLLNFREYAPFVGLGAIEPIADHLDVDADRYYDAPMEAFTLDGKLQCFPQNASSLVVYYNTELFAEAGIDPPEAWTWDDLRAVGEALTSDGVRGIGLEPQLIRLAPFVWGNGGELTDDPDEPTRFTLDEPASREALEYLIGLARDGLTPTREELAAEGIESQFINGRVATILTSRRETPVFREARGLSWDVAPLPVGETPVSILHSDAYCMAAGAPAMDAAARFIELAVGARGQTITALGGRTVPSLRSVAEGPFLDPGQPPAHAQVFLDAIPILRRTPVTTTWPEIEGLADEVLERLFFEPDYPVDAALEDLEAATSELFSEASESG